jgi:hypothetical protein
MDSGSGLSTLLSRYNHCQEKTSPFGQERTAAKGAFWGLSIFVLSRGSADNNSGGASRDYRAALLDLPVVV